MRLEFDKDVITKVRGMASRPDDQSQAEYILDCMYGMNEDRRRQFMALLLSITMNSHWNTADQKLRKELL